MKIVKTLTVLVIVFCSGCAVNMQRLGTIDTSDKTIYTAAGGRSPIGELKSALRRDGWKIYSLNQESVKTIGESVRKDNSGNELIHRESCVSFKARYTLVFECQSGADHDFMQSYDISLIDNKTGSEVLVLSGERKWASDIVEIFMDGLHGRDYKNWWE